MTTSANGDATESVANVLNVQSPVRGKLLIIELIKSLHIQNIGDNTTRSMSAPSSTAPAPCSKTSSSTSTSRT